MAIGNKGTSTRTIARKLHRQFAHPRPEILNKLISKAGIRNKKLQKEINEVSKTCITCLKHKKPPPRPVVCLPLASRFNEMIGIDLKKWNESYFLVMVDIVTRFCQAYVIPNKMPSAIIKALFVSWISIFGAPTKILSDNGGEFSNNEIRDLSNIFSIKLLTTAAESPWSNGICERLNSTLGEIVSKIMDDTDCGVHIALAWAVAARNAFDNKSGVSPNQMVFGFNPSHPNIYDSSLPASSFEDPSTDIIKKNCDARDKAREIFVRYEANERIRKALRHNVRQADIATLQQGDEVLYKRKDNNKWQGPAKVAHIDISAKTVTVNHGGFLIKAHAVSVMKIPSLNEIPTDSETEDIDELSCETLARNTSDETTLNTTSIHLDSMTNNANSTLKIGDLHVQDTSGMRTLEENSSGETSQKRQDMKCKVKNIKDTTDVKIKQLKIGQRFQGIEKDTGKHIVGKILNRAGKVKGTNKHCFNVEKDDGWRGWMNMENIQDLQTIPDTIPLIIGFNNSEVAMAKDREVEKWRENNVFEEVKDNGQPTISVRWVITEKVDNGKANTNARLVARGFEEDTSRLEKDSPTCSRETVTFVVFFARINGWKCYTIDVKAAYLQGDKIERIIYLLPPEEYYVGYLWKLNKTVYGLCDASKAWYDRVCKVLIKLGVTQCLADKAIFFWYTDNKLGGIIALYVDDFLYAGSQHFIDSIIKKLMTIFKIGSTGSGSFTYVGYRLNTYQDGITLDQEQYINSIKDVYLSKKRKIDKTCILTKKELAAFRTLVGQLSWVSTHTRPDIAFEVCELGAKVPIATISDLISLNHLVKRIQTTHVNLYFPNMDSSNEYIIKCFTDASYRSLPLEGSQAGFIIFIETPDGRKRCPILWQSKKIDRVVDSSLAAEAIALHEGAKMAEYIKTVINIIVPDIKTKITCITDSKNLESALKSTKQLQNRHLRTQLLGVIWMLENKVIDNLEWVTSEYQLADILTKKGKCRDDLIHLLGRT